MAKSGKKHVDILGPIENRIPLRNFIPLIALIFDEDVAKQK